MDEKKEEILSFIRRNGPILPIKITENLEIESYFVSAILSSLIDENKINCSERTIGSSKIYYTDSQEKRARERLKEDMESEERKLLKKIENAKVLLYDDLSPRERVYVKNLEDFIDTFKIKGNGDEIKGWSHYSISEEERKEILRRRLGGEETKEPEGERKKEPEEETRTEEEPEAQPQERTRDERKELEEVKKEPEGEAREDRSKTEEGHERSEEDQKEVEEKPKEEETEEYSKEETQEEDLEEKTEEPEEEEKDELEESKAGEKPTKEPEKDEVDEGKYEEIKEEAGEFEEKVLDALKEKGVEIEEREKKSKKNVNLLAKVPSSMGINKYLIKIRDKKRLSKGDLAMINNEAKDYKRPVILYTKNELGERTQEYKDSKFGDLILIRTV